MGARILHICLMTPVSPGLHIVIYFMTLCYIYFIIMLHCHVLDCLYCFILCTGNWVSKYKDIGCHQGFSDHPYLQQTILYFYIGQGTLCFAFESHSHSLDSLFHFFILVPGLVLMKGDPGVNIPSHPILSLWMVFWESQGKRH